MMLDPRDVARLLGGNAYGHTVLAPGLGHGRDDRSLSVKLSPTYPEGFITHSFAGDDPVTARNHVRQALGMGPWKPSYPIRGRQPIARLITLEDDDSSKYLDLAKHIWMEASDPRHSVAEEYLASRSLRLPDLISGSVIRFHPSLRLNKKEVGGIVGLYRDISTNEPRGIHRIFIDASGQKLERRMLGPVGGAALKLHHDEEVCLGVHIGEGLETCLAASLAGFRPVWAVGSVNAIASFPVLSGVEALTILGELGDGGASIRAAKACAGVWKNAGRDVFLVQPKLGDDLNDVWIDWCLTNQLPPADPRLLKVTVMKL